MVRIGKWVNKKGVKEVILQGAKKKCLKDCVEYFCISTQLGYEDLLKRLTDKGKGELRNEEYPDWLANRIVDQVLKASDISLDECFENKDIMRAAVMADKGRQDGEFYTPEEWCADGRTYLKALLGDEWGKAVIWDASCGTGNLMRSANYPQENVYMSTLLPEDAEVVQEAYPGATVFACDFVDGIDYDDYNTMFSDKLPEGLVQRFKNNEHIVFYMNPPYKVGVAGRTDIGMMMNAHNMGKCGLDLFHQFIYRIISLRRFYNIKNMTFGVFGPVTLYHSRMLQPLLDMLFEDFQFRSGMCFKAGDFSGTSESIDWVVGYTVWSTWKDGEDRSAKNQVILDSKEATTNGEIAIIGKRLFKDIEINMDEWIRPQADTARYIRMPVLKSCMTPNGQYANIRENAIGQLMTSNYVIRATRRAAVTTLPNTDGCDITEENFWRCVASFAVRRCYANNKDSFKNCQYYATPNINAEGYNQWLIDCLPIFLFDHSAIQASYRDFVAGKDNEVWTVSNSLFPLSDKVARQFITDENILKDLENNPPKNQFLLSVLSQAQDKMGAEAKELYLAGLECIALSLQGTERANVGYPNCTIAWDAGLSQIRMSKELWNQEKEDKISNALTALKARIYREIFKFGFLMDNQEINSEGE